MPQTRKPQSEVIQGMSQRMLEGYKLLAKLAEIPGSTETEQIYDVANGYAEKPEEPGVVKVLGGLADFINEFSKM